MVCEVVNQQTPWALKETNLNLKQCPKSDLEVIQKVPYISVVESLMYARVCTCPDKAFVVRMLGRYLCNPGMDHWTATKRVLRNLQRTKDYMFTYKKSEQYEMQEDFFYDEFWT